jgi:hypothetical protein
MVFPVVWLPPGTEAPLRAPHIQLRGLPEARELENKAIELKALFSDQCARWRQTNMPDNLKSFRGLQPFQFRSFEFSNAMRVWGGFAAEAENEAKRSQCDKPFVIIRMYEQCGKRSQRN